MHLYYLLTRKTSAPKKLVNTSPSDTPLRTASNGHIVGIEFPKEGDLRSRKIVTRSRSRATGKYPSWKMGRMIQWESADELNVYRLLDVDPQVKSFQEQPLTISYVLNGEQHLHYPDVLVTTSAGQELWEIKTSYYANEPGVVARTTLMTAVLPEHGFQYRMILANHLRNSAEIANALTLLTHQTPISSIEREALRRLLEQTYKLTWGDVLAGSLGEKSRAHACRLVIEGALHVDIKSPLTASSLLTYTQMQNSNIKGESV
jgi:hypothetical protein